MCQKKKSSFLKAKVEKNVDILPTKNRGKRVPTSKANYQFSHAKIVEAQKDGMQKGLCPWHYDFLQIMTLKKLITQIVHLF